MKTLYFNRQTLMGENPTPISLAVNVSDEFFLEKEIEELDGLIQKEDELGNKIYLKDIYRTETKETVTGYEETLQETDMPVMVKVQKRNEQGYPLYTQHGVVNDSDVDPGMGMNDPGYDVTTKAKDEKGKPNTPIMIEVQQITEDGNLLYLAPIYKTVTSEVYEKTIETIEETDRPVMIDKTKITKVNTDDNIDKFDVREVLANVYSNVVNASDFDYIVADMFLDENDLDLEKSYANTGNGILNLPPDGYAVTKEIELAEPASKFALLELDKLPVGVSVFINNTEIVDGVAKLSKKVDKINIKFENNGTKSLDIKSYVLFYSKEGA